MIKGFHGPYLQEQDGCHGYFHNHKLLSALTWEMSPARALKKGKARGVSENPTLPRASFPHPYDFAG
ncbi:hypothetical protein DW886_20345 [Enterocloster aldenensis]|nr:hypothetical protein DW886_20345 [Enterocloster aldenensis]